MSKPQVLTVKGVKAAARRAYKARTLTAQHRTPERRICRYEVDSCHCGIGAALTKPTLKAVHKAEKNSRTVATLKDAGLVRFDGRIASKLAAIQTAHDAWARAAQEGAANTCAQDARRTFLKAIAA
jgi:hypothetical protein